MVDPVRVVAVDTLTPRALEPEELVASPLIVTVPGETREVLVTVAGVLTPEPPAAPTGSEPVREILPVSVMILAVELLPKIP